MKKRRVISEFMMIDVDIGLNIPVTFPLTIQYIMFVLIEELDIGPRPDTLPTKE